ncbi:MAG: thymidine phosphorylase [Treponema sp.]|nr:thymidine phosphorylase [Treponema sp.]
MRAVDIITKKREGGELSRKELEYLLAGYVQGEIPDYQISAWAMAVFFRGMSPQETAALTEVMLRSGRVMDLSGIPGPLVDKHSTGGVGDKTSLVLAPLAAALGITDPMMAGRALGHTGGTLDKLESIPGYRTDLDEKTFRRLLLADGFAIAGQTAALVPADRLLYALRDVTATVESIPLITASILSKKAAEGARALVMDVKFGSGAFMKGKSPAEALARALVDTGRVLGLRVSALITDMDEPLGNMVGNFLEVEESLDCLEGRGPEDLMELILELGARMAVLGGLASDAATGKDLCRDCLAGGEPRRRFLANVKSQGGDPVQLLELRGKYRSAIQAEVRAGRRGFVRRIDAGELGLAAAGLGVGRNRTEDRVSPTAGLQLLRKRGAAVEKGEPIMRVWAGDRAGLEAALPRLEAAVEYAESPPPQLSTLIWKDVS